MSAAIPTTHSLSPVSRWWRGLEWKTLPRWLPMLLGIVTIVCLAGMSLNVSSQELQARYLDEAKRAFQAKDYARALTCYERLAPVASDRPEIVYRLALTADAAGDHSRATALMRELAPDNQTGYAPAQYWLAQQILAITPATPKTLAAGEVRLLRALDGPFDEREAAHFSLGSIYLNQKKYEEAEFHLAKAAASNNAFRLRLAWALSMLASEARHNQDETQARQFENRSRAEAAAAIKFFRDRSRSDPSNAAARLAWADAVTFSEDFASAIGILEEGLAFPSPEIYQLSLARVYLAWYEQRKKANGVTATELLVYLNEGLKHDPANRDLLDRLADQLRIRGPIADESRKLLLSLLAKGGPAIGQIHFALAIDAHLRENPIEEKLHLERAYELDPKTGIIANNLASILSQPPHEDLPRALLLINAALEREPNNLIYRDTRGQIYRALKRWKEALTDFELILANKPEAPGLHAALADVYDHLGQPALASEHRILAAPSASKKASP